MVATQRDRAANMPVRSAELLPQRLECRISRIRGSTLAAASTTSADPSTLPSSTTTISRA
jgi:hypothetical protein